jgi:hypothetical protein
MLVEVVRDCPLQCWNPEDQEGAKQILYRTGDWRLDKLKTGFYLTGANPENILAGTILNEYPVLKKIVSCGLVDSPQAFISEHSKVLESSRRKFFVAFWKHKAKCLPVWRWRKWEAQVGKEHPYASMEMTTKVVVCCYQVYEVR